MLFWVCLIAGIVIAARKLVHSLKALHKPNPHEGATSVTSRQTVVLLATGWGPKFGGINAFNVELARSLGVIVDRQFDLFCVVPRATSGDIEDADCCGVRLVSLDLDGDSLPPSAATEILARASIGTSGAPIWIGHDDKTGPAALALRQAQPGSRAVLIHHMAFRAYQDHKKGDQAKVNTRENFQRQIFAEADVCLAVGPMLRDHLEDLLSGLAKPPRVYMIVPGLAQPDPERIAVGGRPPNNFTAFLAGRLSDEDEPIKLALLGVKSFASAVQDAMAANADSSHPLRKSPLLRMRGVTPEQRPLVRQALAATCEAAIACDLQDYTEDRVAYFRDLVSSSVVLMPSWHEGFGLVAWEGIACQLPVVIGEQSGVYRLLNEECQGAGLNHSVRAVSVQGKALSADSHEAHTEVDLAKMREAVLLVATRIEQRKVEAIALAGILRRQHNFTWERCANDCVVAMEHGLGLQLLLRDPPPAEQPSKMVGPIEGRPCAAVPDFLSLPQPQDWRLGHAPSRLLRATDQFVAFHPERDRLINAWVEEISATGLPPVTVRLAFGPGGIGKTRSALELVDRLAHRDWLGLWLRPDITVADLAAWRLWVEKLDGPALLVVDYADGRQGDLLHILHAAWDVASTRNGFRMHVLCLSREYSWWRDLPRHNLCATELPDLPDFLRGPGNLGAQEIPSWSDDPGARESAFRAALVAYASIQQKPVPASSWQPDWRLTMFRRPLYLHLAALAALAGERPGHVHQLLAAQIDREWRFWRQHPAQLPSNYDAWADALAWLTLVQGSSLAELRETLDSLGIGGDNNLAAALRQIYGDSLGTIAPLQPDLLGETLVVERLELPHGTDILRRALHSEGQGRLQHVLEVLGRLTADLQPGTRLEELTRWQEAIVVALSEAWLQHGQAFIDAGHALSPSPAPWLFAAFRLLPEAQQNVLAVKFKLPGWSTNLFWLLVEVERVRVRISTVPTQRAAALNNLHFYLSRLSDPSSKEEALRCVREAVEIYRSSDLAVWRPFLITAVVNASKCLSLRSDAHSMSEALTFAQEGVDLCRNAPDEQADKIRREFAGALDNLAVRLTEKGRHNEALQYFRRAAEIYRKLAMEQPSAYDSDLVGCLDNLALSLSNQGDIDSLKEAVETEREAVKIGLRLAHADPAGSGLALAASLDNLAAIISELGDPSLFDEGLASARKATAIVRRLAKALPDVFDQELVGYLGNLSNHLSQLKEKKFRVEAVDRAHEAVEIARRLVAQDPHAYLPDLALAMEHSANAQWECDRIGLRTAVLDCSRGAVELYRQLCLDRPAAFQSLLERAQKNLNFYLSGR